MAQVLLFLSHSPLQPGLCHLTATQARCDAYQLDGELLAGACASSRGPCGYGLQAVQANARRLLQTWFLRSSGRAVIEPLRGRSVRVWSSWDVSPFQVWSEVNQAVLDYENRESTPKLAKLLKLLLWAQNELDQKKVKYPKMTDLSKGVIEEPK